MQENQSGTGRYRKVLLTVPLVVGGLFVPSTPAHAVGVTAGEWSGGGTMTFASTPTNPLPPCAKFDGLAYNSLGASGSYTIVDKVDPTLVRTYTGAVKVELSTSHTWYANPTGLFTDPQCTMPRTSLVPVTATVLDDSLTADLECKYTGGFTRVGPNPIVVTLSGKCELDGAKDPDVREEQTHTVSEPPDAGVTCGGPPTRCDTASNGIAEG